MAQAALREQAPVPVATPAAAPVVIVGSGPAGMRAAAELLRRDPAMPIVIYGDEPWAPYQRAQLTALVVGETSLAGIDNDIRLPAGHRVVKRFHCRVVRIDRPNQRVHDAAGGVQRYSKLILATGARPHIPDIAGIRRPGVYTFRSLDDVQQLMARRARSRCTVVLGGGLLGIEAARALLRYRTEVVLVQHEPFLMNRQLDAAAAAIVRGRLEALGIRVLCNDSVQEAMGREALHALRLRSGEIVTCDTLVVATGISPNTDLALDAGLAIGRGIRVDDSMLTADASIYAIGECAEHRGRISGLLAPGMEQAAVAAHHVCGGQSRYESTIAAAFLKVVGISVFSMGDVGEAENPLEHRSIVYAPAGKPIYRKLVLRRGRLVGAIAIGEWSELPRVQEALLGRRRPLFWRLGRFRRDGQLWPDAGQDSVANWPATATVCQCNGITRGALSLAVAEQACDSVDKLSACTSAGKVCGSCKPLLAQLVGAAAQAQAQPGRIGMLGSVAAALLMLAAFLFIAELPVADSVQGGWQPQVLWLDGFWKQVSGYTLLGVGAIASLLSLRKRWQRFSLGQYPWWRIAHVVLGTLAVVVLLVHTGLRLGNHLNFLLIASFLALTALGSIAGAVVALERVPNRWTRRVRALSGYWHVVLLWPLPALLGFHILKVYYF
jgi:nitrite reductase (NADH) large subunit